MKLTAKMVTDCIAKAEKQQKILEMKSRKSKELKEYIETIAECVKIIK